MIDNDKMKSDIYLENLNNKIKRHEARLKLLERTVVKNIAKAIFDDIREELKIKESDEPTDGYYWMKKEFDNLKKKWLE